MGPPSPIQAFGVNPFPSRFIIRTVPGGRLRAPTVGRANQNDEMTLLFVLHQTAGNSVLTGQTQS